MNPIPSALPIRAAAAARPSTRSPARPSARRARRRVAPIVTLVACALAGAQGPLGAQPAAPEDWPCVQVLVPEILPTVLWPVPIDQSLAGSWRESPEIESLARRLGELESLDERAVAAIDEYAAAVPEAERRDALTRLADGTVSVANERRARYIDGIRRYTRQQIAISRQIEETLNLLADLDDAEAAGTTLETEAPRAEIEETLSWHERLYDQRERAIRALCERPGELEQTLSATLRELAYRLPDA